MEDYWIALSGRHRQKLLALAQRSGLSRDQALERMIHYLRSDHFKTAFPKHYEDCISKPHIESLIDTITL